MNETEKERILKMVAEGELRPGEATQLLAALSDNAEPAKKAEESKKEKPKEEVKPPANLIEVQMQRPDGSTYTVQVPPNLFPMFWQITKVAVRESVRTAARDTWDGLKVMVSNKGAEIRQNVKAKMSGSKTEEKSALPEHNTQFEARRQILMMVQNGRITATDASRLIEELDALHEYEKTHPAAAASSAH